VASEEDVRRIVRALSAAQEVLRGIEDAPARVRVKQGGDPVTEADTAVDACLRDLLPASGEGWLSEETADDRRRLAARRVWIVDPLDGTKEFVAGVPEWSVSIALVEDGEATAGGVCNPAAGTTMVGAVGLGILVDGTPSLPVAAATALAGADVLASRSEMARGEWARFRFLPRLVPMGSVAWKLALVAAGRAGATWTLVPKHEWDVAGGVALVRAAGGAVFGLDGRPPRFNREDTRLPGLVACAAGLTAEIRTLLGIPACAS
jgi:myo-inositol-1(or 4)-monophosphatase